MVLLKNKDVINQYFFIFDEQKTQNYTTRYINYYEKKFTSCCIGIIMH